LLCFEICNLLTRFLDTFFKVELLLRVCGGRSVLEKGVELLPPDGQRLRLWNDDVFGQRDRILGRRHRHRLNERRQFINVLVPTVVSGRRHERTYTIERTLSVVALTEDDGEASVLEEGIAEVETHAAAFGDFQGFVEVGAGAGDVVLDAAFDRSGGLLAAAGADHSISIFSIPDGKRRQHIEQHADWVMDIAFSKDGKRLASASRDRSSRVYNVSDGSLLATYYGHNTAVYAAGFGSDGGLVLSGGADKSIHVWDPKEGKKKDGMRGFGDEIYGLIVTDEFVFSCSADKLVRQHALKGHKLVREFNTRVLLRAALRRLNARLMDLEALV
jgi:hypothetical protein